MPIELGIWKINGDLEKVPFSALETENKLEEAVAKEIGIIDSTLMVIGRQIITAYGKIIDILAINSEGNLTIIELKRNRTPRDVVAQILDYASWIQTLSYDQIVQIFSDKHPSKAFEQAFFEKFQVNTPDRLNESHNLVIASAELDHATERIINYLTNFGVPINVVFFRYFKTGENEYLARTWLADPNQIEAKTSNATKSKSGMQPWNGRDFYVALGDGAYRDWEDCRKYGFVSAGQGRWYSNTLNLLQPGSRVFACLPKFGYVGVGIVQDAVVPIKDFNVEVKGREISLLEVELLAKMDENVDNPDLCEYVVRVEWINTSTKAEAFWEKGMFANQNSACKLRHQFTLERLTRHFGLEEE